MQIDGCPRGLLCSLSRKNHAWRARIWSIETRRCFAELRGSEVYVRRGLIAAGFAVTRGTPSPVAGTGDRLDGYWRAFASYDPPHRLAKCLGETQKGRRLNPRRMVL